MGWAQLTVVKLKAELDKRGLPKNGLKAELVARLQEDDEQKAQAEQGGGQAEEVQEEEAAPVAQKIAPAEVPAEDISAAKQDATEPIPQSVSAIAEGVNEEAPVEAAVEDPAAVMMPAPDGTTAIFSTQGSVAIGELVDDTRKRKRRSQSPPPPDTTARTLLETESVKRVKAGSDESTTVNADEAEREDKMHVSTEAEQQRQQQQQADRRFMALAAPTEAVTASISATQASTATPSPVPPPVHQPTPALYIRDLMRPLNPNAFKTYLTTLAQSVQEQQQPDDTITQFHIDTIRTHAFAVFTSTAAATATRTGLHGQIWPLAERDRRPLWVDYLPATLVAGFIATEQEEGSRGMKRWEVVYDQSGGDGEVGVELREVGAKPASNAQARPQTRVTEATAAVSVPKMADAAAPATSREFKALDDVFPSTHSAKPKIYYLPVRKSLAMRRLAALSLWFKQQPHLFSEGEEEKRRFTFAKADKIHSRRRGPDAHNGSNAEDEDAAGLTLIDMGSEAVPLTVGGGPRFNREGARYSSRYDGYGGGRRRSGGGGMYR